MVVPLVRRGDGAFAVTHSSEEAQPVSRRSQLGFSPLTSKATRKPRLLANKGAISELAVNSVAGSRRIL